MDSRFGARYPDVRIDTICLLACYDLLGIWNARND